MNNQIIFSLSANKKLARKIANELSIPMGRVSIDHFVDGEVLVKTISNVKDRDVVVVESTAAKTHERLFELLLLLDSINRSGAKSVKLCIPYFAYSRQERVSWFNEPVSCEVVAKIIETAKYDNLYSFDLHHPVIKDFFSRGITNLMVTDLFKDYYLNYFSIHGIDISDVVIVAPDHGGNDRVDALASKLGINKIILSKVRPTANQAEHLDLKDDVTNKICIIHDDIIDTGGTLLSATKLLYKKGAKAVLISATHGVFSNKSYMKLNRAKITDIVVSDTIEKKYPNYVHVLSILPIIKKEIIGE